MRTITGLLSLGAVMLAIGCTTEKYPPTSPRATTAVGSKVPKPGAHFLAASAALDGTNLVVSFRESGLGVGNVTEVASATVTALYACQNNGGQFPNAANKQLLTGPESATGSFEVTKNGDASGSLTLSLPPSTLVCPSGQHVVLASFSYTDVSITDATNQVSVAIPGDFSATFYTVP